MPADRKPELSVTGLIAGAGATITATVAASYFGVGGTLIGAGAVSVLSTVGATVYQHFLDRGKAQIVAKMPVRVSGGADERPRTDPAEAPPARPWPKWYVLAGAATGVFLAVMGLVTAFELFTGRPLSNTVRGRVGGGTSVHPARVHVRPAPVPPPVMRHVTPVVTPSAEVSHARTPSPVETVEPAPRPSPSAASAGPLVIRSQGSPQAPPPSDDTWRTP
jgi:hypothetical protein